jgi:hypothetical protein
MEVRRRRRRAFRWHHYDTPAPGTVMWCRDGELVGHLTGGYRRCRIHLGATHLAVRWNDGRLTYVCERDMYPVERGAWRVGIEGQQ